MRFTPLANINCSRTGYIGNAILTVFLAGEERRILNNSGVRISTYFGNYTVLWDKRMLISLLKLLLLLVAVPQGSTASCSIAQAGPAAECYRRLGETVYIKVMTDTNVKSLEVKFNGDAFHRCRLMEGSLTSGSHKEKCLFNSSGTIQLDDLNKNNSGNYIFEVFDINGTSILRANMSLTIQEPVSRPLVSQLCLSTGEIKVSCSSSGDYPEYNWTLEHLPLNGTKAFLSNETKTVILKKGVSGLITCKVSNRVSQEKTTQELRKCPGLGPSVTCTLQNETEISVEIDASLNATALLHDKKIFFLMNGESLSAVCASVAHAPNRTSDNSTMAQSCGNSKDTLIFAVLGVCVLLLALLLGTCCLYKKKQKQPKMSQRRDAENSEGHQDLVYCQVQVVKKNERPNKKAQEPKDEDDAANASQTPAAFTGKATRFSCGALVAGIAPE
ncbi:hypothetical protein GJAV_G00196450 [Gymnothorax javanicus]|nr:hypothetical protein GJAV_G00196450 [Gymnothorax javanicus]